MGKRLPSPVAMSVDINLDHDLYTQFSSLEKDLNVTQGTYREVKSFLARLTSIQKIAKKALAERLLSKRTVSIIHNVALTGSAIAMFTSRIEKAGRDVEKKREAQLEEAMARLTLKDRDNSTIIDESTGAQQKVTTSEPSKTEANSSGSPNPSTDSSSGSNSLSESPLSVSSTPLHVTLSFKYLLANLHNPFLTSETRKSLAQQSGVSEKVISDWFVNIRQKIGWTAIQREHFSKSRPFTVDSARIVLLYERSKIGAGVGGVAVKAEVIDAFKRMKGMAERLYKEKCEPNIKIEELDVLIAEGDKKPEPLDEENENRRRTPVTTEQEYVAPTKSRRRIKRQREDDSSNALSETNESRENKRIRTCRRGLKRTSSDASLPPDLVPSTPTSASVSEDELQTPSPTLVPTRLISNKRRKLSAAGEGNLELKSPSEPMEPRRKRSRSSDDDEVHQACKRIRTQDEEVLSEIPPVADTFNNVSEPNQYQHPLNGISFEVPDKVSMDSQILGEFELVLPDLSTYDDEFGQYFDAYGNPISLPTMPSFDFLSTEEIPYMANPYNLFSDPYYLSDISAASTSANSPGDSSSLSSSDSDHPPEFSIVPSYPISQQPVIVDTDTPLTPFISENGRQERNGVKETSLMTPNHSGKGRDSPLDKVISPLLS